MKLRLSNRLAFVAECAALGRVQAELPPGITLIREMIRRLPGVNPFKLTGAGPRAAAGPGCNYAGARAPRDPLTLGRHHDPRLKLLMTLPGVEFGIACNLAAALGDITRFRDGQHAASYLGLAPSTRQSGEHCYHGPITRHGNPHARWLLVQAAQHLAQHPGPLGVFFRRLLKKKNRNVAAVACARKPVVIAWHMLSRNEPYRYAQPMPTQAKLTRLRTRVTGLRRRGGSPKGAPRPANYVQGRTRRVPSLAEAYAGEDLPAPFPLSPGEQRMLRDRGLARFAHHLQQSTRVPKPGPYNPRVANE